MLEFLIDRHGGITPADAYRTLCAQGSFRAIDAPTFAALLRDLGAGRLIRQESDGLLLHAEVGERLVSHYTFYAAFAAPTEYRIVTAGRTLGSLPLENSPPEGALLIPITPWISSPPTGRSHRRPILGITPAPHC
ncbi:hypothetical protein [Streptosporangium sp. NPDC002607]